LQENFDEGKELDKQDLQGPGGHESQYPDILLCVFTDERFGYNFWKLIMTLQQTFQSAISFLTKSCQLFLSI